MPRKWRTDRRERNRRSAAGDFAFPAEDFYEGGVAGFIYRYPVTTWSQNSKCEIRCIDFDGFVFVEAFYANVDGAFGEATCAV